MRASDNLHNSRIYQLEERRKLELTKNVFLVDVWKQEHSKVMESMKFSFHMRGDVSTDDRE